MKAVLHTPTIRTVTITNIIISVFIPYEHGTAFALILPGWPSISAEQLPSPPARRERYANSRCFLWFWVRFRILGFSFSVIKVCHFLPPLPHD